MGTGGEPSAAGFSVGSIDKVQATNGGRLSFDCLLCDNIQFQREHPDWTGPSIAVTRTLRRNTISPRPSRDLPSHSARGPYRPHCMDGETEGQSGE